MQFNSEDQLAEILRHIFLSPIKVQSDAARLYAQEVACLASLGLISTQEGPAQFGRTWRVTGIGLDRLRELGLICN